MEVRYALDRERRLGSFGNAEPELTRFLDAVWSVGSAYLATLGSRFTIFLVPAPAWRDLVSVPAFPSRIPVRIYTENSSWFIEYQGMRLFSFDLPEEMLQIYRENGLLAAEQAWDLKQQFFKRIQLVHVDGTGPRIFWLEMDQGWQTLVEQRLRSSRTRRSAV